MMTIPGVLTDAERQDQMQQAVNTGLPFLVRQPRNDARISIVGYGPSLLDTWQSIPHPMIATSGAYDFLVGHGVIPDYYTAIDPRKSVAALLTQPRPETEFLMASVCHPDFWTILDGLNVRLWHLINGNDTTTIEWVRQHHPLGINSLIGGGSTVGQRAMNVASALGYRKFDVFGIDCSFTPDVLLGGPIFKSVKERHAGPHTGEPEPVAAVAVNGRRFLTTPQLMQSANELQQFLLTADAEVCFHGDGLIQEIAKMLQRRQHGRI